MRLNDQPTFKKPRRVSGRRKIPKLQPIDSKKQDNQLNQKIFEKAEEFVIQPNSPADAFDNTLIATSTKRISLDAQTSIARNDQNMTQSKILEHTYRLKTPYQFLKKKDAAFHTILFPHFTLKSITFIVSTAMTILFIIQVILNYTKPQDSLTWSCTLFRMQNKFFPRLRIIVSAFFHSNISHFILNLVGINVYGYFIQWYYGKLRYSVSLVVCIIASHLLCCVINQVTISTTSSSILYAFLAMKCCFFIRYRQYKPLENRKYGLYGLLLLVFGINFMNLFVGNNIDYGSYIAGFVTGVLCGIAFYPYQQQDIMSKIARFVSVITMLGIIVVLAFLCFNMNSDFYHQLNTAIDTLC